MEATQAAEVGVLKPPTMLPSIKRFLEALPEIQPKDLSTDHKSCNICMERFTDDTDAEKPIYLRCGHIFGSFCIKAWVSSSQASQPTCPMCRVVLTPSSSIERWEYFATVMQQQPYTSLCETLHGPTGTSSFDDRYDSAVELVSLFYQVVMQILRHHRYHDIPASALLIQSAQAVASRMGCLYILLKPTIDMRGMTVPWGERGPSFTRVLDLKSERGFEKALDTMAQMERSVVPDLTISV